MSGSRIYPGLWRVLLVWREESGEIYGFTEPTVYEDCEGRCLFHGLGVPFEGHRVVRALIVPVAP